MLGFLSNLRDVKSSLSAGMMLLLTVWLAFGHQISNIEDDDTLAGNVARLVAYLGPVPTIAAVTFFAYILGLVLALDTLVLRFLHWAPVSGPILWESEGKRLRPHVERIVGKAVLVRHPRLLRSDLAPGGLALTPQLQAERDKRSEDRLERLDFRNEQTRLVSSVMRQIYLDTESLAAQLGKSDEKAYDRFDKARGESEFRAGLVIPLLFVACVCAQRMEFEGYPWWSWTLVIVTGLTSMMVLLSRANNSARKSREEVHIGIIRGDVRVVELEHLGRVS